MHPAKHPKITAGILSVSPVTKLEVCISGISVVAGRGCVGWLKNTATPKSDHWTNDINFPQCFILLQKCTGRMKEQTTDVQLIAQNGSWLLIPAIQCQSLPRLTQLQPAPMWRYFREAMMGTVPEQKKQNKTQNNFSATLPFKNFAVCLVLSKWHPCTLAGLRPTAFNQTSIHPKE